MLAFEANIGLVTNKTTSPFGTGKATTKTSGVDLGFGVVAPAFLFAFISKPEKSHAVYLNTQLRGNWFSGNEKYTTPNNAVKNDVSGLQVSAWLGAEWFVNKSGEPKYSLQAAVGLAGYSSTEIGGNKDQNTWAFNSNKRGPNVQEFINATVGENIFF